MDQWTITKKEHIPKITSFFFDKKEQESSFIAKKNFIFDPLQVKVIRQNSTEFIPKEMV
jgi:hypothetical protein